MSSSWIWTNQEYRNANHTICLEPCGMALEIPAGAHAKYTASFSLPGEVGVEVDGTNITFFPEGTWQKYSVEIDSVVVYEFP